MEDGVNGVSKKRRKKTGNSVTDDGDVMMADTVPSPPLTEEIPITNGRSVGTQIEEPVEILEPDMVIVEDGEKGTLSCAWNPVVTTLLATASMGSAALIWNVPEESTSAEALEHIDLSHEPSRKSTDKAKVTAIRWSPEGNQLASGSYDGQTRIWSVDGRLEHGMWLHFAPPTSLKWNKTAKVLLALSCDGKMIAWDTTNGETIRMFDMGKEGINEIEWISTMQFIACGDNGDIHQFDIGVDGPLHSHTAHQGEVACIAWDEATETVATGGADASVLIWHKPSKESKPENKLQGHTAPIVSVAWQPGAEFVAASPKRILASASDDCTVRIWEVGSRTCLRVLSRHLDPIERICFSPDGSRLASGANGAVLVWRVESGTLTHVYDRSRSQRKNGTVIPDDVSEIGEISWDEGGQRLAIGEGSNKCAVITIGSKGSTTPAPTTSNGSA
ncbi:WD40-repeat-containing domain protein [Tricharina praecox]|uniref:WD40-repeat-containing domain protein n=1 Tax=Tricharina praecox TaxID=43433 RepID=UPI002220CB9F|nr:WD40-repeat-containing domain protein [Tricharina praecox]KAI5855918.1 WD40-repeat-containing domain protein [Tricharina praecox]